MGLQFMAWQQCPLTCRREQRSVDVSKLPIVAVRLVLVVLLLNPPNLLT